MNKEKFIFAVTICIICFILGIVVGSRMVHMSSDRQYIIHKGEVFKRIGEISKNGIFYEIDKGKMFIKRGHGDFDYMIIEDKEWPLCLVMNTNMVIKLFQYY